MLTWTQAQHPPEAAAEREPLHAPTRALLLLLLRKACRTSTLATARNGPAPQRAAGREKKRLSSQADRKQTKKGEPRQFAEKSLPCAVAPHTPGGGQGRQADDKEGGGGGGGGRGRTTASASPAAVGLHGIVAQGVGGDMPPIVLEGYQDGMQVNFLSYPSTAAAPVPPAGPRRSAAAAPSPDGPEVGRSPTAFVGGGAKGKRDPPTVRRRECRCHPRHTRRRRDGLAGDEDIAPMGTGSRILVSKQTHLKGLAPVSGRGVGGRSTFVQPSTPAAGIEVC